MRRHVGGAESIVLKSALDPVSLTSYDEEGFDVASSCGTTNESTDEGLCVCKSFDVSSFTSPRADNAISLAQISSSSSFRASRRASLDDDANAFVESRLDGNLISPTR